MLVVAVSRVLSAPPNNVLVKHSGMDAHTLRYGWVKAVHHTNPNL